MRGQEPTEIPDEAERDVVYCLVPAELADKLHEPLRRRFREDPGIEVVVERRRGERRQGERRDSAEDAAGRAPAQERRLTGKAGRRAAERRVPQVEVEGPELPKRFKRYADQVVFVKRRQPPSERREDLDTARIVARVQAGDKEAFGDIYVRYYERVYAYLRLVVKDIDDAEDLAQEVFTRALEALPRYEQRTQPFRAWLFTIVRNAAIDRIAERNETLLVEDPEEYRRADPAAAVEQDLVALDWVTDPDLSLLIERLPLLQRQILLLRYMFDLDYSRIGAILGKTEDNVRAQNYRALEFLRERLAAIGKRFSAGPKGAPMRRTTRKANVLRARRYALDP